MSDSGNLKQKLDDRRGIHFTPIELAEERTYLFCFCPLIATGFYENMSFDPGRMQS